MNAVKNLSANDIKDQRTKVTKLLRKEMVKGDLWYIISFDWWNKWDDFTKSVVEAGTIDEATEECPGPVDNRNLLCAEKLKSNLLPENDITLVPEEVWNIFVDFYSCFHTDTSVFQRRAIQSGKLVEIEIYPPKYAFYLNVGGKEKYICDGTFSKFHSMKHLKSYVGRHMDVQSDANICILVRNDQNDYETMKDDVTIGEAGIEREQVLFVVVEPSGGSYSGLSNSSQMRLTSILGSRNNDCDSHLIPGVCGLSNLGNTCFMNSAIQCMSNVPALTSYFLSPKWKSELNVSNLLGSRGRIATAYADLIKQLWSGTYSCANPREFKIEIGRIAHQFIGCAQHDIHELLVFLLDGLHEDLNRIHSKPYMEVKDSDGRPDKEVADEAWNYYKMRNDSIVVDLFHGQLKSTVFCPTCQRTSITFDPFASLILPIPEAFKYTFSVYLWPWKADPVQPKLQFIQITISGPLNMRNVVKALTEIRPVEDGCSYYTAEKHIDRVRYMPRILVYELMDGHLIPVNWSDGNLCCGIDLPLYISIPYMNDDSKMPITEPLLLRLIAERLYAVGVVLSAPHSIEDSVSESLNATKLNSDIHLSGSDSLSNITIEANGSSDFKESQNPIFDQFASCFKGRLVVKDTRGRDCPFDADDKLVPYQCFPIQSMYVNYDGTELKRLLIDLYGNLKQTSITHTNEALDLSDCFDKFVESEQLSARDLWYCKVCKEEKPATKKFDLWKLPDVLVVQLKRFRSHSRFHDKIDCLLNFPITGLDLTSRVLDKTPNEQFVYDLVAVSNHTGYLGGGHYTAFGLNSQANRWYHFDDSSTRAVDSSAIVTNAAYVLVYVKRMRKKLHLVNENNNVNGSCLYNGDHAGLSNSHSVTGISHNAQFGDSNHHYHHSDNPHSQNNDLMDVE